MTVLGVLGVIALVIAAVVAAIFVGGIVHGARLEWKRQQILAEQAQAEARIQLATSATLNRLFAAAREAQRQSHDRS
jgi:hypothetical protein